MQERLLEISSHKKLLHHLMGPGQVLPMVTLFGRNALLAREQCKVGHVAKPWFQRVEGLEYQRFETGRGGTFSW